VSHEEVYEAVFGLSWEPLDDEGYKAFAGAAPGAKIAVDDDGNIWVRSLDRGVMAIDVVSPDYESLFIGLLRFEEA